MSDRTLDCERHGTLVWHGEVICSPFFGGCGRIWQLMDIKGELFRSGDCECGKPIDGSEASPIRAICAVCFVIHKPRMVAH